MQRRLMQTSMFSCCRCYSLVLSFLLRCSTSSLCPLFSSMIYNFTQKVNRSLCAAFLSIHFRSSLPPKKKYSFLLNYVPWIISFYFGLWLHKVIPRWNLLYSYILIIKSGVKIFNMLKTKALVDFISSCYLLTPWLKTIS